MAAFHHLKKVEAHAQLNATTQSIIHSVYIRNAIKKYKISHMFCEFLISVYKIIICSIDH